MAVPLIVLAALSVVVGFINVPSALSGNAWLTNYLKPVFQSSVNTGHHLSHSTEYVLMAIVLGLTVLVIAFAYGRFVSKENVPAGDGHQKGMANVLYHKYYIDEIYDHVIVKPLFRIATFSDKVIERLAIDKVVNTLGELVAAGSRLFRRIQTGSIGFYIFVMVISIIVLLTITTVKL